MGHRGRSPDLEGNDTGCPGQLVAIFLWKNKRGPSAGLVRSSAHIPANVMSSTMRPSPAHPSGTVQKILELSKLSCRNPPDCSINQPRQAVPAEKITNKPILPTPGTQAHGKAGGVEGATQLATTQPPLPRGALSRLDFSTCSSFHVKKLKYQQLHMRDLQKASGKCVF